MCHWILKNALTGRFFYVQDVRMPRVHGRTRAAISSLSILFSSFCFSATDLPNSCVSTHFDETVSVQRVIDGDTIVLSDERHVRLTGINTPELNHNNKPSQAGAELARNRLLTLLKSQSVIKLKFDKERFDRHGRTLAHLYLGNGMNIQAQLLLEGLAMPLTIPPNVLNLDCYTTVSQIARNEGRALWALPQYKPQKVTSLTGSERGFHMITGKVRRVSESRSALWINLENNVALRIVKDDLDYFSRDKLKSLPGELIEAKGWLYKKKGQLRMRIRHPIDLNNITSTSRN